MDRGTGFKVLRIWFGGAEDCKRHSEQCEDGVRTLFQGTGEVVRGVEGRSPSAKDSRKEEDTLKTGRNTLETLSEHGFWARTRRNAVKYSSTVQWYGMVRAT